MINKYEQYLNTIGASLDKFFAQQKPYIFCKEGCAICCETGEYPFSELEFQYAMIGYTELDEEKKQVIQAKVKKIKEEKKLSKKVSDKKFLHECPFLLEKKCSIYKHRGIICRSYGLAYYTEDKSGKTTFTMPCCVDNGLNYSNVYDQETGIISSKKWAETGIETEPVSHNVSLDFLKNNNITKELELDFGEARAIIDWF